MASVKQTSSGVIAVRGKQLLITPPGILGFNCLVEPDDAFDSLKFNAQVHYTEEARDRLITLIQDNVIEPLWDNLVAELKAKSKAPKGDCITARTWVEDHQKTPSEKSPNQNPFIKWENQAEYRDAKTGKMERKTMHAYDAGNKLLDLPALKLGRGSTVQAVLIPGLYVSPLLNGGKPAPSFKLQGVRVLNLVQFGGSGSRLGDVDDADLSMLGDDVEVSDLGAYAAPEKGAAPKAAPARAATSNFDAEDEIPF